MDLRMPTVPMSSHENSMIKADRLNLKYSEMQINKAPNKFITLNFIDLLSILYILSNN